MASTRSGVVYAALLSLAALDAAGYGMLAPIVPEIAERTETGPGVAGALVACFALGQLFGYPFAGRLAQRHAARSTLLVSLVLLLAGDLAFVLGDGLDVWFPGRIVQGVGAAGLWIGVTFGVLERWPDAAYGRLTGVLAAYSVGAVAGPALGAVGGVRGPFLLHMALTTAAFAPLVLLRAEGARPRFGADRSVLKARGFLVAAAGALLAALVAGTIDGPLPVHLGERLSQVEIASLYVGVALVVAAGALVAGRMRPGFALWSALVLAPVGIGVAGAVSSVPIWILMLCVAGAAFGLSEAGAMGVLLGEAGPERIVTAWVVWSQLWAVGYLVGPAAAGLVAETAGFAALGLVPLAGSLVLAWALLQRE